MQWTDDGIVLAARPHGETSAIATLFTRDHGRHLGLVRGGRAKRLRPVLQTGNVVTAEWRARLAEHLGFYVVELADAVAARALEDRLALAALGSLAALGQQLAERDPHPELYDMARLVLAHIGEPTLWPALMVRWELMLLGDLGFPLDLSACAVTGAGSDLVYVSPKSGRAVSAAAGAPYRDRLLPLPPFLTTRTAEPVAPRDVAAGLALTGHFLERHVLAPQGLALPGGRGRILAHMAGRAGPQ